MNALPEPLTFSCEQSTLLGMLHRADTPSDLGVLTIVAGGPQYRGGCGRQLTELGSTLSAKGVHVFRFDHRGMGDSDGEFRGFEDMLPDLKAAIAEFRRQVPDLKRVILWGGCDAASAALINAPSLDCVVAVVAANPWITTQESASKAQSQHYLRRLGDLSFWRKLFSGGFDLSTASEVLEALKRRLGRVSGKRSMPRRGENRPARLPFLQRMLEGVEAFDGHILFLISGKSTTSREFQELLKSNARWANGLERDDREQWIIEEADQTFASTQAREAMLASAVSYCSRFSDGSQP